MGITGSDILNIDSLGQITEVHGSIQNNASNLMNINGRSNLTEIEGSLGITFSLINHSITLPSLAEVGGNFEITSSATSYLFNSLSSINGNLVIHHYEGNTATFDFNSLTHIGSNITLIGSIFDLNIFLLLTVIHGSFEISLNYSFPSI
ncbi:MAG: hypothetical protein IPP15_21090 [Saprospiraceae bacterium]|uniref:Uncharacterized protein n=1 Tax=Candidatus Opimibacter skivensis TaxID=2982028 RepID=A0A9D7SX22_9BACT|nr:hypothetical protein [Candidatus Opimibacter skivensis]